MVWTLNAGRYKNEWGRTWFRYWDWGRSLRPVSHWGEATAIRSRKRNHFTVAYWSNPQFVIALLPPARPRCDDESPWIKCSRRFSWSNLSRVDSVGDRPYGLLVTTHIREMNTAETDAARTLLKWVANILGRNLCLLQYHVTESESPTPCIRMRNRALASLPLKLEEYIYIYIRN
jgi:hypothetical protein